MKSVTVAVIISGLVNYWGSPPPIIKPVEIAAYSASFIDLPPSSPDPDDDEDETRVNPRKTKEKK